MGLTWKEAEAEALKCGQMCPCGHGLNQDQGQRKAVVAQGEC